MLSMTHPGNSRARAAKRARRALLYVLAAFVLLLFTGPFLWLVSTAFKTDQSIFRFPPELLPNPPTLASFHKALFEFPFFVYFRNSLFIALWSAIGVCFSSALVAFSLACLRWPDRNLVFSLLMATMMIPGQILLIPHFVIFRELHWIDTSLPLIVPAFLGNAFFIFYLRQYLLGLPTAYLESARVDGAGVVRIFFQIVLPLIKPALMTVFILAIVGAWNDFMGPLIYLSSEEQKTLAIGLSDLRGQYNTEWGMMMASALMMTAPILLLFFLCQRVFIEAFTFSGVKA